MNDNASQHIENEDLLVEELKEQVSLDLLSKLDTYNDKKKGLKVLSNLMGIHEKTLKRLIDRQNKPGYQTLLKLYRVLLRSSDDNELLHQVPEVVKNALIKCSSPRGWEPGVRYSLDIDREMEKDPIFREIYFFCSAGSGVSKEWIGFQYGQYGEKILNKMVEQGVVANVGANFILGPNRPSLKPETLKSVAIQFCERFIKVENSFEKGANFAGFYAAELDEQTYQKWIEIDEKAFKEKVELVRNKSFVGGFKAFCFCAIDTLTKTRNELH